MGVKRQSLEYQTQTPSDSSAGPEFASDTGLFSLLWVGGWVGSFLEMRLPPAEMCPRLPLPDLPRVPI